MASFDENGKYIKTNWKAGDKITATKLNKIEESIEAVNDNDISRHVEADARLDALEAKDVAHDKEFTNVKNTIADNKAAAELGDYEINSRMTFLENELNEGIEEVHNVAETVDGKINAAVTNVNNVAETVDGKIATAEANMTTQVNQGKADMEAMVDKINASAAFLNLIADFGAKGDGNTDDTQAIQNAVDHCITNRISLYIPNGRYKISEPIKIVDPARYYNGVDIIGQSKQVVITPTHEDFAFIIEADRTYIENLTITGPTDHISSGIWCKSSQCIIDNVIFSYCNVGIKFSDSAWCSNTYKINMYSTRNAYIMDSGCGGGYIEFMFLSGTAGYSNPVDDGSVAILVKEGAGFTTIGAGGQIDSFAAVFDLQGTGTRLSVDRIYVEHNYRLYASDSRGLIFTNNIHSPANYTPYKQNVIDVTPAGVNKTTPYNLCKDSAIPIYDLLAYFTFNKKQMFTDLSGNSATIDNTERLILSDDKNLFGNTNSIAPPANGSTSLLTIPNIGNKFTIIVSFRHSANHTRNNHRIFEFLPIPNNYDIIFCPDAGLAITKVDRVNSTTSNTMIMGSAPYNGENSFVAFGFDLEDGKMYGYNPYNPVITVVDDVDLTLGKDGNFKLVLFRSWTEAKPIVFNYLAVFDGILEYDQLTNIYRQTKPLK